MSFRVGTLTEEPLSAFARLRLAASRATASPVAQWPLPELSIGQSCSPLGGLKCWEVIGPALSMSLGILKAVKELLDPVAEYLHEQEPKPSFIAFGMYMIGREEARSNPTLLISCERKNPRQKAVKLVKESSILREVAGIRLAESPRPPLCSISPVPLHFPDGDEKEVNHEILSFLDLYWDPTEATHGVPLYTRDFYTQRATLGGIISINGDFYGLSAAHGFIEDSESQLPAPPNDEVGFEISFDDWMEDDDMREVTGPHSEDTALGTAPNTSKDITVEEAVPCFRLGSGHSPRQAREYFGFIYRSSLINGDIGLDWTLIKSIEPQFAFLSQSAGSLETEISGTMSAGESLIHTIQITDEGPARRDILAITGMSGIIHGVMSQSPTFMKTLYGKSFQEMWSVRLDRDICRGDSGSWVVDSSAGNLYGHIVSGCPGSGIAYIIPAKHIALDIEETLHGEISLPQSYRGLCDSTQDKSNLNSSLRTQDRAILVPAGLNTLLKKSSFSSPRTPNTTLESKAEDDHTKADKIKGKRVLNKGGESLF